MERSDEEILRNSLPFVRTNRAMMEGSAPSMCVPTPTALGLGVHFTEHCDIAHTRMCTARRL